MSISAKVVKDFCSPALEPLINLTLSRKQAIGNCWSPFTFGKWVLDNQKQNSCFFSWANQQLTIAGVTICDNRVILVLMLGEVLCLCLELINVFLEKMLFRTLLPLS